MREIDHQTDNKFVTIYSWIGIVVVCILSIPLHFVYEWTNENTVASMFTPINESIWEHLKLVFWPLILWWLLGFLLFNRKKNLDFNKWISAAATSILISMAFIVSWYYTWVYGLDTESSIIDIGSLFIAVPISQLVAIHVYKVITPRPIYTIAAGVLLLVFAFLFIWFTFNTPDLSLFIPPDEQ